VLIFVTWTCLAQFCDLLESRVWGGCRHDGVHADPMLSLLTLLASCWVFEDALAISSQARSPAWQPRSFLEPTTTWINGPHSVHRDTWQRHGCTKTNHIQCTQMHDKTWLNIFFWWVRCTCCSLTSTVCPEQLSLQPLSLSALTLPTFFPPPPPPK
jgi:hypothetical protein